MSGYRKGTRKPKSIIELKEINVGGLKIPPAVAIVSLLAASCVIFLAGSILEAGSDALVLSVFSLLFFAAFAYLARRGSLAGLGPFARLIDAFLGLSILTLTRAILSIVDLTGYADIMKPLLLGGACTAVSLVAIGALLAYEKGTLKEAFVKAGSARNMAEGAAGFLVCVFLGLAILYFLSGRLGVGLDIPYVLGIVLVFSLLSAACEELWFRGLLLSRLRPLVGDTGAIVAQAAVFGVFEAAAIYALYPMILLLPVLFIGGAVFGFFLGKNTIKDDSLIASALYHAGFYAFIGLTLFAGIL